MHGLPRQRWSHDLRGDYAGRQTGESFPDDSRM
jgi:hypothetical protein